MRPSPPLLAGRAFGFVAVSVAATWALTTLALQDGPTARTGAPPDVDELLTTGLLWGAVALSGWLACIALITLLGAAPGALGRQARRVAGWLTPHCARRALSLALGVSVGTVALPAPVAIAVVAESPATNASTNTSADVVTGPGFRPSTSEAVVHQGETDDAGHSVDAADAAEATPSPGPGWVPDRPAKMMSSAPGAALGGALLGALRPSSTVIDTVTVRRGDSLWSIAARHLGPAARDAEIAAEWPRWYDANRDVIGGNPDVVVPGQLLRAPVEEVAR